MTVEETEDKCRADRKGNICLLLADRRQSRRGPTDVFIACRGRGGCPENKHSEIRVDA
jgi:hypothetical protein